MFALFLLCSVFAQATQIECLGLRPASLCDKSSGDYFKTCPAGKLCDKLGCVGCPDDHYICPRMCGNKPCYKRSCPTDQTCSWRGCVPGKDPELDSREMCCETKPLACTPDDTVYARYDGDSTYAGSITSTDSGVFDITFADGSTNDDLPPSHVFSTTNDGCPGTWRTNVCSAESNIWAQYAVGQWYYATISSMTGTDVTVDWDDGTGSQTVAIGETALCDCNDENCVTCVDHCSCDGTDTIPDNTNCDADTEAQVGYSGSYRGRGSRYSGNAYGSSNNNGIPSMEEMYGGSYSGHGSSKGSGSQGSSKGPGSHFGSNPPSFGGSMSQVSNGCGRCPGCLINGACAVANSFSACHAMSGKYCGYAEDAETDIEAQVESSVELAVGACPAPKPQCKKCKSYEKCNFKLLTYKQDECKLLWQTCMCPKLYTKIDSCEGYEGKSSISMVTSTHNGLSLPVYGFAGIGLAAFLYGSYNFFCTKSSKLSTQFEEF